MQITPGATPYARYIAQKPPVSAPAPRAIETAQDLRQVLSAEEETFFQETAAQGPLWYRRNGAATSAPSAELGQRLDVRG